MFLELCKELREHVQKIDTVMRAATDVETQVAIILYYLVDEERLRKVGNAFGVSISIVSLTVRHMYEAITIHLGPKYTRLPQTEQEVKA